jgi:DNA-binding MarR family transcriptional regulator
LARGWKSHGALLSPQFFESDNRVSQRSLAKVLGIAIGLTSLIVKRLVRKGWVRVIHIKPNRVRYLITPAGIAEKTRMSRAGNCDQGTVTSRDSADTRC